MSVANTMFRKQKLWNTPLLRFSKNQLDFGRDGQNFTQTWTLLRLAEFDTEAKQPSIIWFAQYAYRLHRVSYKSGHLIWNL